MKPKLYYQPNNNNNLLTQTTQIIIPTNIKIKACTINYAKLELNNQKQTK